MASSNFDELNKTLASSTSRRQTIKALFAGLGGILGFASVGTALARANCGGFGAPCHHNSECCSGDCSWYSGQQVFSGNCTR